MSFESVEHSRHDRAARELGAAEAALAVVMARPTRDWSLMIAALQIGHAALNEAGQPSTTWYERLEARHGQKAFARPASLGGGLLEDATIREASKADVDRARCLLLEAGLSGFSYAPDPLSSDSRTDVPAFEPDVVIVARAGITGVRLPLRLDDQWPVLSAEVDVAVEIKAHQRGAHMSRLQEAIVDLGSESHPSALVAAERLAKNVSSTQPGPAYVTLRVDQQPSIRSAITSRPSSIDISTVVVLEYFEGETKQAEVSLTAQVMTACPCTIAFSKLVSERKSGMAYAPSMPPTFTHSQPGTLTVGVEDRSVQSTISADLLNAIRGCSILRESVLKRPDEHELVDRAHRRPQFTEDLARLAAAEVATRVTPETIVFARAVLKESIHPHSAAAQVRTHARELRRSL